MAVSGNGPLDLSDAAGTGAPAQVRKAREQAALEVAAPRRRARPGARRPQRTGKFGVGGGAVERFAPDVQPRRDAVAMRIHAPERRQRPLAIPLQTSGSLATCVFEDETEGSARQEFFVSLSERPRGAARKTFRRRWCVWRCL